jgi:hypothetical protein
MYKGKGDSSIRNRRDTFSIFRTGTHQAGKQRVVAERWHRVRYPSARKAVRVAPKGGVSASTTIVVEASLFIAALGENIFFIT